MSAQVFADSRTLNRPQANYIDNTKAKIHKIQLPKIPGYTDWIKDEQIVCDWLNNNKNFVNTTLTRGDIIEVVSIDSIEVYRYRGNGSLIWNGSSFLCLEIRYDEYGHIPREFLTFQEFPLNYFQICPNTIHHTDISQLNTIENIVENRIDGEKMYCNSFIIGQRVYTIGSNESLKGKKVITFELDEDLHQFDFVVVNTQ